MYTRKEAVTSIKNYVINHQLIRSAWEGGSVATGFADQLSDLDLCLVCKADHKEKVLKDMVLFLENTFGKEQMYRMPEPAWHGFSQIFFKTKLTPDLFYVDFVVIDEEIEDKLTEPNRHGYSDIWKEEYKLNMAPRSQSKIDQVSKRIYDQVCQKDFVLIIELKKALRRGIFSEAFPVYMSFISRCLVPLMNIKYRPEKADFGLRYIYRDYPEEVYHFVEDALRVANMEMMQDYTEKLMKEYNQLKEVI